MKIKRIKFQNYTVFEDQQMEFSPGINVIIGENGTGKTHLMKALYSACQSADKKTSFSHKLVMTMLPDDYKISRLITRKTGNRTAVIRIAAKESEIDRDRILSASFHGKTKKWDAEVTGEDGWENSFAGMSSIFIPAKEILSHSYNLNAATEKNNILLLYKKSKKEFINYAVAISILLLLLIIFNDTVGMKIPLISDLVCLVALMSEMLRFILILVALELMVAYRL